MNDILLIGGPTTLTGVDRIGDDLLSILAEENLYSRKSVVVWPTKDFLALPTNPDLLGPLVDSFVTLDYPLQKECGYQNLKLDIGQVQKMMQDILDDPESLAASRINVAMSEAVYRLSRLIPDVLGGLRLVVVVGKGAPDHALCWTGLVGSWKSTSQVAVKRFDTKSVSYGALNAVKEWGLEFDCLVAGLHKLNKLLPIGDINACGQSFHLDLKSYEEIHSVLKKKAEVSFPVESRVGAAMAVQAAYGDGFMLVMPEPDKPKNFRIGLMAGGSVKSEGQAMEAVQASPAKPRKTVVVDAEYVTVKEASNILKCSTKSIRNYYGDGRLKHKKVGERKVLILKSSVDALLG